jgi:hypothetical protein
MWPTVNREQLLSLLSNVLGIAGLICLPAALNLLFGSGWALLAVGVECLLLSYLAGLAQQQAKAGRLRPVPSGPPRPAAVRSEPQQGGTPR